MNSVWHHLWEDLMKLSLGFPVEIFVAAILYGLPLEKRSRSLWRIAAGAFLLTFLYSGIFYQLVQSIPALRENRLLVSLLYSLMGFLFLIVFGVLWRKISWQEAVVLSTNAYLTQHFAYCCFALWQPQTQLRFLNLDLTYLLIYSGVYLAAWLLFSRKVPEKGHYDTRTGTAVVSSSSALLFSLVLSAMAQQRQHESAGLYAICLLSSMAICFYILWSQLEQKHRIRLSQELDMQQELFRKHKEQYEMAAENVELINRKCHDLKHQISALKFMPDESARKDYIRELERSVMIYDSVVKTGNEILDTILTEKSLVCEAKQIQLSCVADGEALSFMDAVDVYTIFGNAIDNAIESVSQLPDPGMRGISLLVTRKGDMVMIQTENYYESQPDLSEGLPSTTKQTEPGYHGFGLKSIRYTAEKYGGFMTVETANSIFLLRVVLPVTN